MNGSPEKWSTLAQVKSALVKKWHTGLFLRDYIEPGELFPFRIPLRGPEPNDLSGQFARARAWVQQIRDADTSQNFRIEWQEISCYPSIFYALFLILHHFCTHDILKTWRSK
jgi:hypothetical protein